MADIAPRAMRADRQEVKFLAALDSFQRPEGISEDGFNTLRTSIWMSRFMLPEGMSAPEVHIALIGAKRVGYIAVSQDTVPPTIEDVVVNPREDQAAVMECLIQASGIDGGLIAAIAQNGHKDRPAALVSVPTL
jgi:hypothetical protein